MRLEPFLDKYCERTGPGLADEPLNAITNLAFFAAAVLGLRLLRRELTGREGRGDLVAALVLFFLVGIGSTLWHTLAAGWAEIADATPIFLLVLLLFGSTLRRVFGLRGRAIAAWLLALVLFHVPIAALIPARVLGGSLFYAPAWLALGLLALVARARRIAAARALALAFATFTISLVLRTLDEPACLYFPLGTHFLWHVLNAALLFALFALLVAQGAASGSQSASSRPRRRL
jgi:hypothetical protein